MKDKRFPDNRVDNERFSGSAVMWLLVVDGIVLFLIVLCIVYQSI